MMLVIKTNHLRLNNMFYFQVCMEDLMINGVSLSADEETVLPPWWGGRMLHPLSHIWGSGSSLIFGYQNPA